MDISSMRSRIVLQKATPTTDAIGNHQNAWDDYHSCFAYVNLTSGKEYAVAGQIQTGDVLTFTIRWCEKLRGLSATGYRILCDGQLYNITSVDDPQFTHTTIKLIGERVRR